MGPKRDHYALTYSDNEEPAPQPVAKRRKERSSAKSKTTEPQTDATYGQRTAFPGLDEPAALSDEDLEFEDQGDALAYLRSVRQEANGIPHLLVAPKAGPQLPPSYLSNDSSNNNSLDRSIYHDGLGDSRGYYQDGAYTAAPDNLLERSIPEDDDAPYGYGYDDSDSGSDYSTSTDRNLALADRNRHLAREAYFASLMSQFSSLRNMLHQIPPQSLLSSLDKDHGYQVGSFGPKSWTFRVWTKRIRYTDPLPHQVAAMDRFGALKLLRVILGGKFIRRGCELRERTSRWIWALLARLPDRGEMDHTDIGWVRELGKRAVLMMVSIAQMAALKEKVEGDLEGAELAEDEVEEEVLAELEPDVDNEGVGRVDEEQVNNETRDQAAKKEGSEPTTTEDSSNPANLITEDDSGSAKVEQQPQEQEEAEEGEIDMDIDDGEVLDDDEGGPNPNPPAPSKEDAKAAMAAAKARLLAQIDDAAEDQRREDELMRQRLNMRATLNMILTVAGEFYGQRDLLEFRDPFPAL
ncbi:hypothetical protein QBC32DRAFT_335181 [Pseudoneurospora amorphoporcata]|uniref:Uncharacterized protein n=1 Tax=Pseudoneurospora amorphoporcata TaxID=241081 RepID=A0AAN6P3B0_9PEZI|nr:hypothetical protein QBC32DRAFT_335181 [Pseudoneurospora amorphoporcata]